MYVCVFVVGDRPSPLPDIMTLPVAEFFKGREKVEKELAGRRAWK